MVRGLVYRLVLDALTHTPGYFRLRELRKRLYTILLCQDFWGSIWE